MVNKRQRHLAPARPYLFLHCVDGANVTSVPTALVWGYIDILTSELYYKEGDDRVVVLKGGAGLYEVMVSVCVEKSQGNAGHTILELYVNGTVLDCSEAHGYMGAPKEHSSAFLFYTVYLNRGDYIQTYISVDNGSGNIETNTGRFHMRGLPMRGWNNDAGGKISYKGHVMR